MSRPFKSQNMMSEHIQSIRDLDLELELLKRKRELMEKQNQITNIRQSQYGYNQPERYQRGAPSGSDYNYTNLYQDPAPSNYRDRSKPPPKKRFGYNSNNNWNEAPPPKRSFVPPKGKFGGGSNLKPNKFFTPMGQPSSSPITSNQWSNQISPNYRPPNQRTRTRPNKPSTGFGQGQNHGSAINKPESLKPKFIGQRIANQKQTTITPKKDFTPTKVNKNKKKPPVFPQKDKQVIEGVKIQQQHEKEFPILRPDKVPTQQMAGRLELGLGRIMKDIKEVYGGMTEYYNSFTPVGQRTMKQAIRERLRGVMLGKPVGHLNEIVNFYRQTFPKDTDIEIVKMGANKPSNTKQDAIKVAGEYFKKNMYKLIHVRLDDLFKKVQDIYKQDREAALKEEALNEKPVSDEKPESNGELETNEQTQSNEQPESNEQPISEATKEQSVSVEPLNSMDTENPNEQKSVEAQESSEILGDEKQDANNEDISEMQNTSQESKSVETLSTTATESNNATIDTVEIKDDDNDIAEIPKDAEEAKQKLGFDIYALYDKLMNSFLDEKLPKVFPTAKYKQILINTLDIDLMYEKKKFDILWETRRLIQKGYGVSQESGGSKTRTSKTISPDDDDHKEKPRPAYAPLPYYVKIIGKPSLPKRQVMQGFLDQFHPKSIKKVKSLRNLLFAGFDTKEDFDGIVAATGTVIGNDTLTVKVSKWVTNKNENINETNDSINDTAKSESDSLINSDLDSQISDLLSTIRNEEENQDAGGDGANGTGDNSQDGIVDGEEKMDSAEGNAENNAEGNAENNAEGNAEQAIDGATNMDSIEEVTNEETGDDSQKHENADNPENNITEEKHDDENNKTETKEAVATPTRASTRLASGAVRTRRASRLAQN